MKTQFNNLSFNKSAIVELNANQMRQTDSGVTPVIGWLIIESSVPCGIAVGGAIAHTINVTMN